MDKFAMFIDNAVSHKRRVIKIVKEHHFARDFINFWMGGHALP